MVAMREDANLSTKTGQLQIAKISLLDFVELENFLSDLLGMKVDLVEKSALKPRIGKHILKEVVFL